MIRLSNAVLLAIAAGVGGGWVGAWISARSAPRSEQGAAANVDQELLSAVRSMNSSLQQLASMTHPPGGAHQAPTLDSERNPVASTELGELQKLQGALDDLSASMRLLADEIAKNSQAAEALRLEPRDVPDAVFSDLLAKDEARLKLEHFGWTPQMVLDAYGEPDDIGPSPSGGGAKWYYSRPGMKRLIFWFIDQRVASVIVP